MRQERIRRMALGSVSLAAMLAAANGAAAQTQTQAQGPMIEELIVTAQKRAESLQDAAVAVSALDGNRLEDLGASQFSEYYRLIPGLQVIERGPGQKKYILRGLNSESAPRLAPIVQQYVDEFPLTLSAADQVDLKLYDIERIEVLRGPQGTLYGSASMGGTVKSVTRKPVLDEFSADIDAMTSSTKSGGLNYSLRGVVNVPVVEGKLALRLSAFADQASGFIDNILTGEDNVNETDVIGGRFGVQWTPTEALSVTFSLHHQELRADGTNLHAPNTTPPVKPPQIPPTAPWFPPGLQVGDLEFAAAYDGRVKDDVSIANLLIDYDLIGDITLTSSSTLYRRDTNRIQEGYQLFGLGTRLYNTNSVEAFGQEVRLSDQEGAFKWLVGGFYFKNEQDPSRSTQYVYNPAGQNTRAVRFTSRTKQTALFGEVSYDILPDLTATFGARAATYDFDASFFRLVAGRGEPPSGTTGGPFSISEDVVTTKYQLTWSPEGGPVVYAVISDGFRPGGYNDIAFDPITNPNGTIPDGFTSDSLWNHEIGVKTRLWDGRGSFNTAVFYLNWSDVQVSAFDDTRRFSYTTNAGSAKVYGVETEFSVAVTPDFQLTLSGAYVDATLGEDQLAAPGFPGKKGDRLPNVPKWSGAMVADYRRPIGEGLDGFANLVVTYTGRSYTALRPQDPAFRIQHGYILANLRVGVQAEDWRITAFADNLTDKRAELFVGNVLGWTQSYVNTPRTVGVAVSRSF